MKISEILKVGAMIGAPFFPALAAVLPVVNALLPDGKKLPDTATGAEINAAINGLPPEQQEMILNAEIDLEKTKVLEHTKVIDRLAAVDLVGASTRPASSMGFTYVVCYVVILVVTMWAVSIYEASASERLQSINNGWPMILALIAPLLTVIRSYFGMRTDEKNTRQHTANGLTAPMKGLAKFISAVRK